MVMDTAIMDVDITAIVMAILPIHTDYSRGKLILPLRPIICSMFMDIIILTDLIMAMAIITTTHATTMDVIKGRRNPQLKLTLFLNGSGLDMDPDTTDTVPTDLMD